jgi:hypothetical protein
MTREAVAPGARVFRARFAEKNVLIIVVKQIVAAFLTE